MTAALDTRANPKEPYGDVTYADPGYQSDGKKRYPLDSEAHCRAAWSYINMPKNAAMYSPEHLAAIKKRIVAAGKKYGIDFATRSADPFGDLLDDRRRPYPGQHYKHGWIPVGAGVMTPDTLKAPTSMSDVHYELDGLTPLQKRQKMAAWGWSHQQINEMLDAPNSMSDAHLELDGLSTSQKRKKMQSWGWTDQEIKNALRSASDPGDMRGLGLSERAYDFEPKASGDGRTLEGYVAVFGSVARISDRNGDFDEEIHRGVFDRYLGERGFPVMQFDHGKDTRVGSVPIGVYDTFEPDAKGYFVRARLLDNPVVEPVRQAIEAKALRGMSFRFMVTSDGGQRWTRRTGQVDKRDVLDADVPEAGPVVFPAYNATSVGVRNILARLDPDEARQILSELMAQAGLAVDLSDLTGRPVARSTGGGETDAEPQERNASPHHETTTQQRLDHGALQLRGILQ